MSKSNYDIHTRYIKDIPYAQVWELQRTLVDAVQHQGGGHLLLVEHLPVITIGKNGKRSNILISDAELVRRGIEVFRVDRGGDVTYHGPGQLVVYPIVRLSDFGLGVKAFVEALAQVQIGVLKAFSISAAWSAKNVGVWVGDRKIGSLGIRISMGVSSHGFALNLNTDLSAFELLNPCGMANVKMTSVLEETGKQVAMEDAMELARVEFMKVFGRLAGK